MLGASDGSGVGVDVSLGGTDAGGGESEGALLGPGSAVQAAASATSAMSAARRM
jgi:hypothetical protein